MTTSQDAAGERIAGQDRDQATGAELLSVEDVAALLSCSPRHVYRLADAGKMPRPLKLGALCRWSRSALSDWIAQGCPRVRAVRR